MNPSTRRLASCARTTVITELSSNRRCSAFDTMALQRGKAMKRLFLSAALAPLACPTLVHAETTISTAVATPVRTSTAAAGQPDSVTITATGSLKPTAAGAAVTLDAASRAVVNKGAIAFDGVNGATGVLLVGGAGGGLVNSGQISLTESYTATDADNDGDLDGPFAQGAGRYGVRAAGPGVFA